MSLYIRSKSLPVYRIIFVFLFFLMSFACVGIIAIEGYADINVIASVSGADKEALFATLGFMGVLSFFTALIMIFLMRERRGQAIDRRQRTVTVGFANRRTEEDRRG